ncbi:MAG TPA: RNA 2',3'-cyclic phosphodiesterase [Anaerolineaceae bacterium]|nr:RNA 2',3'-cyclic phosphodiesterase [Anaerolineaceae bacterium]HPN50612.1 RNA 2',3'-cyclic phosphodiesterase [Anaerolineaceae bacterium]
MDEVRLFIAIPCPPDLRQNLDQAIQTLRKQLPYPAFRWVKADSIHLTLKFFGETPAEKVPAMAEALARATAGTPRFPMAAAGMGVFPNHRQPRVLWAALQFPTRLLTLQERIEEEMSQLGFPREKRPFSPHLTLARISNPAPKELPLIARTLPTLSLGILGSFQVQQIHLIRSELRPEGARYTTLSSADLDPIN